MIPVYSRVLLVALVSGIAHISCTRQPPRESPEPLRTDSHYKTSAVIPEQSGDPPVQASESSPAIELQSPVGSTATAAFQVVPELSATL